MGGNDSEMARDGGPGVREVMITKGKGECGAGPRRKTGRRGIPLQQQQKKTKRMWVRCVWRQNDSFNLRQVQFSNERRPCTSSLMEISSSL